MAHPNKPQGDEQHRDGPRDYDMGEMGGADQQSGGWKGGGGDQGGTGPRNEFRGGGYPGDTERKGYQHQGAGYGGDYGGYGHGEWQGTGGYENRGQDRRHGGPYAGQGGYGQERAGDRRRPKPE